MIQITATIKQEPTGELYINATGESVPGQPVSELEVALAERIGKAIAVATEEFKAQHPPAENQAAPNTFVASRN